MGGRCLRPEHQRRRVVIYGDKTFKPLASRSSHYDYAAFVQGSDEQARLICSMVTVP